MSGAPNDPRDVPAARSAPAPSVGWGVLVWRGLGRLLRAVLLLPVLVLACSLSRVLDGLALGEATAHSLGLPLAPLRLLALEGRDRLVGRGVPCSLLTGEENVPAANARVISSTIEMVNTRDVVDVAVIDEAQMIFDDSRGWAWTQAIVGVPARELTLEQGAVLASIIFHAFLFLMSSGLLKPSAAPSAAPGPVIARLTSLMEPIMILAMGVVVFFIVV